MVLLQQKKKILSDHFCLGERGRGGSYKIIKGVTFWKWMGGRVFNYINHISYLILRTFAFYVAYLSPPRWKIEASFNFTPCQVRSWHKLSHINMRHHILPYDVGRCWAAMPYFHDLGGQLHLGSYRMEFQQIKYISCLLWRTILVEFWSSSLNKGRCYTFFSDEHYSRIYVYVV